MAPLCTQRPFQMAVQTSGSLFKTQCSVEVNQLRERASRQVMKLWVMQLLAYTKGGVSGRYTPARWWWLIQRWIIVEIDWLAVLRAPGERGSSQKNCRKSSPSNAGETDLPLTTHTTIHTHIKYQHAGQSSTKAKLLKEIVQKMLYTTYYLEETSAI